MRAIAIMNNKGGVGKTVTAVNLADILVRVHGKRVVLVDCDGQRNATRFLFPGCTDNDLTVAELLIGRGETCWEDNVHTVYPGLQLLPGSSGIYSLDVQAVMGGDDMPFTINKRALLDFRKAVEEDGEVDFLLFDCPPGFTTSSCAAILACDEVVIPAVLDGFSFDGIEQMQMQLLLIRRIQKGAQVTGVLINQWHRAEYLEKAEKLLRSMKIPVFGTVIRRTDKVPESTFAREPMSLYSPTSAAGRDFRDWVMELLGEECADDEV